MTRRAVWVLLVVGCVLMTGGAGMARASDEQAGRPASGAQSAPAPEARIDINVASLDELMKVPGMTRSWANRIIRFRPYRAKNELLDKGIVSVEAYDRIKDYIIAHRIRR